MAETSSVQIEYEPAIAAPEEIIKPIVSTSGEAAAAQEISLSLYPSEIETYNYFETPAAEGKPLLINIETTGLLPFESKIISIAYQDLSEPNSAPQIIVSDDEQQIIEEFLYDFENGNYTHLVGWNLSFDYRFIFGVSCLYRRSSPKFYNIKLTDVQQIYQQVKQEFVYGFQKTNKLTEWSEFLLGLGKLSSQEEVLQRYLQGDFDFIREFQARQLEMTKGLYDLARYFATASPQMQIPGFTKQTSEPIVQESEITPISTQEKKCPECLQNNPINATECSVCGYKF